MNVSLPVETKNSEFVTAGGNPKNMHFDWAADKGSLLFKQYDQGDLQKTTDDGNIMMRYKRVPCDYYTSYMEGIEWLSAIVYFRNFLFVSKQPCWLAGACGNSEENTS